MIRERSLTRLAFATVLAILPVQYFVEHRLGEPYPSLIMPSFSGDRTTNGQVQTQSAAIEIQFCDTKNLTILPNQFFDTLPSSHVMPVMGWMFGPRTPKKAPISRWKRWVIRYISPGYGQRVIRAQSANFIDRSTRQWLSERIKAKYGSQPETFRVFWYIDRYDLSGSFPKQSRRLAAIVPVMLNSCSH